MKTSVIVSGLSVDLLFLIQNLASLPSSQKSGHHTWDDSTDASGAVLACCWGGGGVCVIMELAKVEGEGGRLQMIVVLWSAETASR